MDITAEILAAGTGATPKYGAQWLVPIQAAAQKYEINTANRIAAWLANIGVESGALIDVVEGLNYSAPGLIATWPNHFDQAEAAQYARNPEAIANRAYAGRNGNGDEASGDGWKYKGRGLLQVTGRANYQHLQVMLGLPLIDHPELLEIPANAALSAGQYWADRGLAALADVSNFQAIASAINTGSKITPPARIKDYPKRLALYGAALKVID